MNKEQEPIEVEVIVKEDDANLGRKDIQTQRKNSIAALGYVLFLIPMIVDFNDKFYRFHANQSLCLLIYLAIVSSFSIIPVIGWFFVILGWILGVFFFFFGVISAYTGNMWRIPIIGVFDLIDSDKHQ